ncbi:MAG TPA: hypothetical protein VMY37_35525 [Thermoguttaceae bacterium]|nr:hypothetical protein [Thermoguttaceae bacterium]
MRLISLAWTVALATSTMGVATEPPASRATLPEPITTRQTLFSIPFHIGQVENTVQEPTEVRLYVSADRGINWQVYSRVKPEQGKFLFRAVTDGEYWFAIRTLDRSGQPRPEGADSPGLRVVVDTTLPDLQLDARQGEAGQIVLRWQVAEPYLDLDTLKIQYRTEADDPWQSVAIDPQRINRSGTTCAGEVIWWPEARSNVVEIRAEVADTAGNSAVSHAQLSLNRVAAADRKLAANPTPRFQTNLADTAPPPGSDWRPSADFPIPARRDYRPAATSPPDAPISTGQPPEDLASSSPAWYDNSATQTPGPRAQNQPAWAPPSSVAANVHPPMGNQYGMPQEQTPEANEATGPAPTATATTDGLPQMVNSRLFELEYDVDSVGPSGIGRVVLWGTRDGGRAWTSFGTDRDNRSPMLVTVPDEGIYGFRVGVENGVGLGGKKPQSGDPPQVRIGVDLTKPDVRFLSAEQGTGEATGQLIIRWEAGDQMLAARPVSLFYCDTRGGPWLRIASGLENTGRYAWSVDRRLAERIYFRVEVRDQAGNVGLSETTEAVALDPVRPAGRIGSVRPVVDAAQASSGRYRFR